MLAILDRSRYQSAFEPGCSNGGFTSQLALRCDHLEAWDVSPLAIALTGTAVSELTNVSLRRGEVPEKWPEDGKRRGHEELS